MKKEKTWKFGRFTAVCQYASHIEQVKIFHLGTCIATGNYTWINRTWQRYDYEMALQDAFHKLMNRISRGDFEKFNDELKQMKQRLVDMHDYNWSNWN